MDNMYFQSEQKKKRESIIQEVPTQDRENRIKRKNEKLIHFNLIPMGMVNFIKTSHNSRQNS